ncbi:MAG: uracil-DNA glycosylase [Gemmatimonadetes bacterium]|nr:uracil-DNA glycosylase [Gemmatimonadota bacterium]
MDARDRLRRYLEQRRELGESEFVLDALPLEEVLKVVGMSRGQGSRARGDAGTSARSASAAPRSVATGPANGSEGAAHEPAPPPPPPAPPPLPAPRTIAPGLVPDVAVAAAPAARAIAPAPVWLTALDIPLGLAAGAAASGRAHDLPTLDALGQAVAACTACGLHKTARRPVPGEGPLTADVMCVGEAPGADEDEQGRPFVGAAGQLLTKILGAIGLSRDEVYICNVLKHRPPGNRDPLPDEVAACHPFLLRQVELVQPRVIIALGRFAAQTLLQTTTGIGQLRGQVHRFHTVPLVVTYHPAALLRNEAWKRPTWDDVRLARRILDASRAAATSGS